jgi:hypothetical protein
MKGPRKLDDWINVGSAEETGAAVGVTTTSGMPPVEPGADWTGEEGGTMTSGNPPVEPLLGVGFGDGTTSGAGEDDG